MVLEGWPGQEQNGATGYIMGHLEKVNKTIPIYWAYPMFPLDNFTLSLVETNIKITTCNLWQRHLLIHIYKITQ